MFTASMNEKARRILQDLKTLRDETRVQIHLADLDTRDKWVDVERRFRGASREVRAYTSAVAKIAAGAQGRALTAKIV